MSTLNGDLPAERLMEYRAAHSHLPGHPELGFTPGVKFSSGRLGHMWPYVNGVAIANPRKVVFCLGSDGSQQEGNDAEAARLAVAQGLNVKLIIDDNNVTIAGHPSHYLPGCTTAKTLAGQGVTVLEGDGEDLDAGDVGGLGGAQHGHDGGSEQGIELFHHFIPCVCMAYVINDCFCYRSSRQARSRWPWRSSGNRTRRRAG